jgi:hypothetical protein
LTPGALRLTSGAGVPVSFSVSDLAEVVLRPVFASLQGLAAAEHALADLISAKPV